MPGDGLQGRRHVHSAVSFPVLQDARIHNQVQPMTFRDGPIDDVIWKPLTFYRDPRGWLCELFRHDELPDAYHPVMAYMSMTEPGIARGPHEHVDQSDYFCFIGPSDFKVYLWDARPQSATFGNREVRVVGEVARRSGWSCRRASYTPTRTSAAGRAWSSMAPIASTRVGARKK